ncbi:ribonuclease HII [Croceitalea rosinachiae]|uniref:Ribonuclease HII n=1 Tax=Croceitalea rosinachiae TaxID=3075596 RepID=A0ABU3A9M6_9FLAO|nr:ribonuclease HII [Croceitalea sp. F388]MDT0606892.1 ribonuclease HII [Croceitalea sp. F388]
MKFRIVFLFMLFLACKEQKTNSDSVLDFFPKNAVAVLKINNLSNFKSEIKNSDIISKTKTSKLYHTIQDKVNSINFLNPDSKCTIAFYELGKDNFEFLFVSAKNTNFFNFENISNKTIETLEYENRTIQKYQLETTDFYSTEEGGKIIVTSSLMLIENSIRTGFNNKPDRALQKLFDTADPTKAASLFINFTSNNNLLTGILKESSKVSPNNFADWVSVDFATDQNLLSFSGVTIANDSIKSFVNLFKGTTPMADGIAAIAPKNSDAIVSYSFGNYEVFAANQKSYLDQAKNNDTIFNTIEEVGLIYLNTKKTVVLNSFGSEDLSETITNIKGQTAAYQGREIFEIKDKDWLSNTFNPLIQNFQCNYGTIIENSFLFAQDKEMLQSIIANVKSGTTFNTSTTYNTAMASLANEASILFVASKKGIQFFLDNEFDNHLGIDFKKIKFKDHAFGGQVVADQKFFHTTALVSKINKTVENNSVGPLFTVELDTDLATDPQFVKNHRTNKQELIVQDTDNFLYLISTNGKVLWKKQLEGRIRGKVHQVDIYKNRKLQLAFCTNNQFLILDRNGEEVPPFNKKFEGGNLNPLAVFDYENTKNYRFVVTQGRKIFMYNNKAEIVTGFTYAEANSPILRAPKHFRMSKKDYLVFLLEDSSISIRHRAGQERLKVSEKINFSDNEVFLYKNKFSTTDKKGVLHQINTKGELTKTNFNLGSNHGMYATSKTLALMNENTLSIKGKKVELEIGVYTSPKIFYINDKIYVSLTDIQNQKIYLFDSQAKPISNFPVYGNSLIDLVDMDGDKKLELVAKDQENSIIVYKIN